MFDCLFNAKFKCSLNKQDISLLKEYELMHLIQKSV